MGVTTATCASATLVLSQVPPMPTSTIVASTGASAKAGKGHARQDFEERQRHLVARVDEVEVRGDLVVRRQEARLVDRIGRRSRCVRAWSAGAGS
jgi:hypothetical protein